MLETIERPDTPDEGVGAFVFQLAALAERRSSSRPGAVRGRATSLGLTYGGGMPETKTVHIWIGLRTVTISVEVVGPVLR